MQNSPPARQHARHGQLCPRARDGGALALGVPLNPRLACSGSQGSAHCCRHTSCGSPGPHLWRPHTAHCGSRHPCSTTPARPGCREPRTFPQGTGTMLCLQTLHGRQRAGSRPHDRAGGGRQRHASTPPLTGSLVILSSATHLACRRTRGCSCPLASAMRCSAPCRTGNRSSTTPQRSEWVPRGPDGTRDSGVTRPRTELATCQESESRRGSAATTCPVSGSQRLLCCRAAAAAGSREQAQMPCLSPSSVTLMHCLLAQSRSVQQSFRSLTLPAFKHLPALTLPAV